MRTNAQKTPAFKGLSWHREKFFSFFIPIDWHRFEWMDGREGVLYGPSADDPQTVFAVDVKDLGMVVTPDDLDDLAGGFIAGIEQLPGCAIDSYETWHKGALIGLEAKYTYRDEGVRRKRWVRILYHGTRQVALTAQGATCETFDYWLPMFFEAMMTAKTHYNAPTADALDV